MKTLQEKIDIMSHFLNGGDIEFFLKEYPEESWDTWNSSVGEPSWNWEKYDYRIKKMSKFRLPTKEEFEELIDNFSKWDKANNGLLVENEEFDILFLPAMGYMDDEENNFEDIIGYYWSSTVHEFNSDYAYYLNFSSWSRNIENGFHDSRNTVRLVSDEPFEGGVEFNGIYWKRENESGYYTYKEAMDKFNK